MIAAHWALHAYVAGSLIFLSFGLSFQPKRLLAARPDAFEYLNTADQQLAERVMQETLETRGSGDLRLWRNDLTGNSGGFMALRTFKIKTGHFCRDYRETTIADSKLASRELTACRNRDGVWTMIEK
jgi:surface antigen